MPNKIKTRKHMIKTYQYRLQTRKNTEEKLLFTLEQCRLLYNKILETKIKYYEIEIKSLSMFDCNNLIKTWEIKNVNAQVLQNVSARVDNAFKGFFRRLKTKEKKAGFPRFRGFNRYDSFTFPQYGFKLNGKYLKLQNIGIVKVILHRPIEGRIKTCTIKRNGLNQWFVSFVCEIDKEIIISDNKKAIGIDVGCNKFAVTSDNTIIEHPHYYRQSEKKLKELQSNFNEVINLSNDNKKKINIRKKLTRTHIKVKNQRKDFLHKTSRSIVNENGIICVEKLNIKKMTSDNWKSLNKSMLDGGWYNFKQMLTYKAEWAGKKVVEVNPAFTSQTCSKCGNIKKKELNERVHNCSFCGLICDRDFNASLNILRVGMNSLSRNILNAV